jgi:hypothetical protein
MRSSWPADRVLRLLAIASVEAAWLTLVYVAIQWLSRIARLELGIGEFGLAVIVGVLLARVLGNRSPTAFRAGLVAATVVAGVIGVWLGVAPSLSGADLAAAPTSSPGGWLLGVAVLRGGMHADLQGETGRAERQLDAGLIGIAVFWTFASLSGLAGTEPFSATAYAATLTFVSAGLISLGLARLVELRVEGVDRAARWRWLILVLTVSALVLVIGIPLAAVLGAPVSTALVGIAGPLAPVLLAVVSVIALLLGLVLELLHLLLPPSSGVSFPDLRPLASPGAGQPGGDQGGVWSAPWADWMLIPLLVGLAWLVLVGIAMLVRRPTLDDEVDLDVEIRESEPIGGSLTSRLSRPRVAWRRPRGTTPRTGMDAYPLALPLLVGRLEERQSGETPREHARRIAPTALGRTVGRLAIDYQLTAFARRALSPAEERRALERWRQVERASRLGPAPAEEHDTVG